MAIPIPFGHVEVHRSQTLIFDEAPESNNNGCKFFRKESHSSSEVHVFFKFTCKTFSRGWLVSPDSWTSNPRYLGQIAPPVIQETHVHTTHVRITPIQFTIFCHQRAQLLINHRLLDWPIYARDRAELISFALLKAGAAVQSMPRHVNALEIHFPVTIVRFHAYQMSTERPSTALDETIRQSMEEYQPRMVPALESAINKSLKGVVITEEMNCTVCLEEMKGGSEGKSMPCSHVFHDDCVRQWLRTSLCCPLCRFELPV